MRRLITSFIGERTVPPHQKHFSDREQFHSRARIRAYITVKREAYKLAGERNGKRGERRKKEKKKKRKM